MRERRPLQRRNRLSDALATTVNQITSEIDKPCSSNPVKVGVNKILADLLEVDGLKESVLLAVYDLLTQKENMSHFLVYQST